MSGSPDGRACAARSYAEGDGLAHALLRQPACFTICASDLAGRRLRRGGAPFVLSIRGPDAAARTVQDLGDGTYACAWEASVSGTYALSILLHGEHIEGSPFAAVASVPAAEARTSAFEAAHDEEEALVVVVAGEAAAARVRYRDAAWQPSPPEPLELRLEPIMTDTEPADECTRDTSPGGVAAGLPRLAGDAGFADLGVSVDPADHAVHLLGFRITAAGDYCLHACLRGKPLSNSPARLRVLPGPPTPSALVLPSSPLHGVAGVAGSFNVRVRDAHSNPVPAGAAQARCARKTEWPWPKGSSNHRFIAE